MRTITGGDQGTYRVFLGSRSVLRRPVPWVLACLSVVGFLFAGYWWGWGERTVTLLVSRPISRLGPSWTYDADQTRFLGTVAEPLCPGGDTGMASVATSCLQRSDISPVVAHLRPGLTAGPRGRPIDALAVKIALERLAQQEPSSIPWSWIEIVEGHLEILPRTDTGRSLANFLKTVPVAFSSAPTTGAIAQQPDASLVNGGSAASATEAAGDDRCRVPEGTGPFFVEQLWRKSEAGCNGALVVELPILQPYLADVVVLRRRGFAPGSIQRLVLLSLEPMEQAVPAIQEAFARGELQGALKLDADVADPLRKSAARNEADYDLALRERESVIITAINPRAWSWPTGCEPAGVLAAEPSGTQPPLDAHCLAALRDELRRLACDPTFVQPAGAELATQPFPPTQGPLYAQPCPGRLEIEPVPGVSLPHRDPITPWLVCPRLALLTNDRWRPIATAVRDRLTPLGFEITVCPNKPDEEDRQRKADRYAISLLTATDFPRASPAAFLWDTLRLTAWFPDQTEPARRLADQEAHQPLTERDLRSFLERELAGNLVALAVPLNYSALHRRLQGLAPDAQLLRVDELQLDRSMPTWVIVALATTLLSIGLFLLLLTRRAFRAERQRRQADQRRRQAEQEQEVARRQVQFLHHELVAPLSTIKAHASSLPEPLSDDRQAITREADAALALVDNSRWLFGREGLQEVAGPRRARLDQDALQPELEQLRRSARAAGLAPTIRISLPPDLPPVAVSVLGLRMVLRNLLDNAFKYRLTDLQVELEVRREAQALVCHVRDWGQGLDPDAVDRLFEFGHRGARARARQVTGSGIGLYVCRSVLAEAGGSIVLTRSGQPTEFVLRLPLADLHPAARSPT